MLEDPEIQIRMYDLLRVKFNKYSEKTKTMLCSFNIGKKVLFLCILGAVMSDVQTVNSSSRL